MPLLAAAIRGHLEVVELLIRAGADVNAASASGRTPVALAADLGRVDVLVAFLRAGASPHKVVTFKIGQQRF